LTKLTSSNGLITFNVKSEKSKPKTKATKKPKDDYEVVHGAWCTCGAKTPQPEGHKADCPAWRGKKVYVIPKGLADMFRF
jgi:hypothetical protein